LRWETLRDMLHSMNTTRKPITTPRQRLQWLVNFTSVDLPAMRNGDRLNIKQELAEVLLPLHSSLAPGGLHVVPTTEPWLFPIVELQALQDELRDELALALARREQPVERESRSLPSLRFDAPYADTRHGMPHRHFCSVRGSIRDVVLLLYFHLMASQDTAALDRCRACERIYLRQPNQRYCRKVCANKVGQRAWRERQRQESATAP
jgi:hypothetical protein